MSLLGAEVFSVEAAIGGPRGIAESVIPYAAFSVAYAITKDLHTSIIWAVVPLVLLAVARLVMREPLTQVVSGAFGLALGAGLALKSGHAEYVFLPSLLKNGGFALAYAFSMVIRWPIIGLIVSQLVGEEFAWRRDPRRLRAYQIATSFWVAMFLIRLAVQLPLYLIGRHNADVLAALGLINVLVLGIPFFALTIWLSWLVLRAVPPTKPPHHDDDNDVPSDDPGEPGRIGDDATDDAGEPAGETSSR